MIIHLQYFIQPFSALLSFVLNCWECFLEMDTEHFSVLNYCKRQPYFTEVALGVLIDRKFFKIIETSDGGKDDASQRKNSSYFDLIMLHIKVGNFSSAINFSSSC